MGTRTGQDRSEPVGRPDVTADRAESLSARAAALHVLRDLEAGEGTGRRAIDDLIGRGKVTARDVGLTTELVMGVVRRRLTLARVLGAVSGRGWKRISHAVRPILTLGAYQLIWMDGIPEFAAVNEAVEQAKAVGGDRPARFVNAVLRNLLREIEHRRLPTDQADPVRAVPIDATLVCQFRQAVMPDSREQPVEHLAVATSHPAWLVSRWVRHFGMDQARRICQAGISRPPVFLRPNRLRTDASALAARLKAEGFDAVPLEGEAVAALRPGPELIRSTAFAEGLFQPQDRTAMGAVGRMGLCPGQTVIDLCAGRGTKATQMAEILGNQGVVLACDKDAARLAMLEANCQRLGLTCVRTVGPGDLASSAAALASLNWILVDAPCSNTGVLARRPEARYRVSRRSLNALAKVQRGLLGLAAGLAGKGTRLLYSTCSIEPEENEAISTWFGQSCPGWRLSASELTLPCAGPAAGDWLDGGYWATWVREQSSGKRLGDHPSRSGIR